MAANGSGQLIIERILRDRQGIWAQIAEERGLGRLTRRMLISSTVALACFGAVLGAFHSVLMSLASAVKLPLLFLITLAICLPTLYFLNLIFGARLSLKQSLAMVMVAITVIAMLAVAFAPISLFFLITAPDYTFYTLLNVAILGISALIGLRFLTGGMQELHTRGLLTAAPRPAAVPPQVATPAQVTAPANAALAQVTVPAQAAIPANGVVTAPVAAPESATSTQGDAIPAPAPAPARPQFAAPMPPPGYAFPPGYRTGPVARPQPAERPASMTLLYVWIVLFGFVGTQLAWTLRPFFGMPDHDFALFRDIEGNFYTAIIRAIGELF